MNMTIKAILFDMDGVLIEAKEWHYDSLNRALALFGMPISRYDHLSTFDGLPTKKKLEILSVERGLPIQLHEFLNILKQKYTMELIQTLCNPIFIHEYALNRLKKEGYKLAVCSNSIKATVESMMIRSNLINYLDFYLSNEEVSKAKPDPEIYLKAINMMNLKPEECLIVEDNDNGIKAAKATGANVMVVSNTDQVNYDSIKLYIDKVNHE